MNYNYTKKNYQELLIQMLTWDFDIIFLQQLPCFHIAWTENIITHTLDLLLGQNSGNFTRKAGVKGSTS